MSKHYNNSVYKKTNSLRIGAILNSQNQSTIGKFIKVIATMNRATADEYYSRLRFFDLFAAKEYNSTVDDLISEIRNGRLDVYDVLSNFVAYLSNNSTISSLTLKQRVVTAKNLLEYYDSDISPKKFKLKVKLPKVIRKEKEALSKEDIIHILNTCSDIRLKTYVMLLAGTGMRAVEALSTRLSDYNFNSKPARVFLRGKYTKTRVDRFVFLTEEIISQVNAWIEYKYRRRRVSKMDNNGHIAVEYRTPIKSDNDLLFSLTRRKTEDPDPNWIYNELAHSFGETLDRIGKWGKEEGDHGKRRRISLHSLRRYVKSTISDLGYGDFSEFMIGHNSSTYYRRTHGEKAELFRKIEPYLTFLDYPTLERKGADVQSKVDVLEMENSMLRQRDAANSDAITNLSDQVMKLMVEVQDLKKQK